MSSFIIGGLSKFCPPQFSSLFTFFLGCAGCGKVLDPTLIPPGHVLFFLVLPSCHTNKSTVGTSASIKHNYAKKSPNHTYKMSHIQRIFSFSQFPCCLIIALKSLSAYSLFFRQSYFLTLTQLFAHVTSYPAVRPRDFLL